MRNLCALVERDDIHAYFNALWRTDEFRKSHESGGYVHGWIDRLAEYPRLVGELSEPRIERPHESRRSHEA